MFCMRKLQDYFANFSLYISLLPLTSCLVSHTDFLGALVQFCIITGNTGHSFTSFSGVFGSPIIGWKEIVRYAKHERPLLPESIYN